MARLIVIDYVRHHLSKIEEGQPILMPGCSIQGMPVLYRADGSMWEEACAYLATRAHSVMNNEIDLQTVQSLAWHLLSYLQFCEDENLDPMKFGRTRDEKPTYLFRGHLIRRKNRIEGQRIAASTASARISAVVQFFSWAIQHGFVAPSAQPFIVKRSVIQTNDKHGIARRFGVNSSDLAIRANRSQYSALEGGLLPVSRTTRDFLIRAAYTYSSDEFALMLDLGFRTGMRIQTICGLTLATLNDAYLGEIPGMHYLRVGPKYGVPTKHGVNYTAQIPADLLSRLIAYSESPRRLIRVASAQPEHTDLLFLNRWSKPYNRRGSDNSGSMTQDLSRLKRKLTGQLDLSEFYFHCTRATFGTSIVLAGLQANERIDQVVRRVKELLGHRNAATTLRYVSFIEELDCNNAIDEEIAAKHACE